MGPAGFSSYNFVYYAAIDVLSTYPTHAAAFLTSIAPNPLTVIPSALADRLRDLYFLNLSEHLIPVLSPSLISTLLIPNLTVYLIPNTDPTLHPHYEAAHSVMLAIIGCADCAPIHSQIVPFYADAIFRGFPASLSARQFRLAFATLVAEAKTGDVLLEMLREKISNASTRVLRAGVDEGAVGLSERDVCVLALVDALPVMEVGVMERWLVPVAGLLNGTPDEGGKQRIRERLWDVLSTELDVSRAEVAVRWWGEGGREMVVLGRARGAVEEKLRPRL